MITKETIQRLNGWQGDGHWIVSVYLCVSPVIHPKGEYFARFRNLIREETERIAGEQKHLTEDIKKIETYLKGGRKEFKKGLVLFSSVPQGLWEVHHLSVPISDQVAVDKVLYLKPLINLMEGSSTDLIVLVDRENARLLRVSQAEIFETAELHHPEVPGKHKGGGWYGRDENRFRRRIDFHVALHLKDVIREVESHISRGGVGRILLGGSEESLASFQKMLPQDVMSRVVGTFSLGMQSQEDEVLRRATEEFDRMDRVREEGWVEELMGRANMDGTGVLGLEDVLQRLQEGKVHRLIYHANLRADGYRCPSCGLLSTRETGDCPYCRKAMERVDHLMDHVIQRAIDQGVALSAISHHDRLHSHGSIGAILRY